jgi:hypothetical protein
LLGFNCQVKANAFYPRAVSEDGYYIYMTDLTTTGVLFRQGHDSGAGCTQDTLMVEAGPITPPAGGGAILFDQGNVYWLGQLGLERVPIAGARTATVIAAAPLSVVPAGNMAADATHLYWTDHTTIVRAPK